MVRTDIWKGGSYVVMEVIDELTDDCYVLTAKGVLVKALFDKLDFDEAETCIDVASYCMEQLYEYATNFTKGDQIPAIVFSTSKNGEFEPIDCISEKGPVM